MLQKLMVALFAPTFALGAFAQGAPKSDAKPSTTSAEKHPSKKAEKHAKGEKKAKSKAKADDKTKTK